MNIKKDKTHVRHIKSTKICIKSNNILLQRQHGKYAYKILILTVRVIVYFIEFYLEFLDFYLRCKFKQ